MKSDSMKCFPPQPKDARIRRNHFFPQRVEHYTDALIVVNRPHKRSCVLWIGDCSIVGLLGCRQCAFEIGADVAFDDSARGGESEDLPPHLPNAMGRFNGPACFHALNGDKDACSYPDSSKSSVDIHSRLASSRELQP